jgi:biopolymer transport protein ExbD
MEMAMGKNFKARFSSRDKIFSGAPDFSAFLNVFFLFLIFVIVSSSFVKVSGIKVDLPKASAISNLGVERFVVTIDKNGKIYFNDQEMSSWDLLKERFVAAGPRTGTVVLRADTRAPFGAVSKLMAVAEEAGLNVLVATVSPGKEKPTVFKDRGSDE